MISEDQVITITGGNNVTCCAGHDNVPSVTAVNGVNAAIGRFDGLDVAERHVEVSSVEFLRATLEERCRADTSVITEDQIGAVSSGDIIARETTDEDVIAAAGCDRISSTNRVV